MSFEVCTTATTRTFPDPDPVPDPVPVPVPYRSSLRMHALARKKAFPDLECRRDFGHLPPNKLARSNLVLFVVSWEIDVLSSRDAVPRGALQGYGLQILKASSTVPISSPTSQPPGTPSLWTTSAQRPAGRLIPHVRQAPGRNSCLGDIQTFCLHHQVKGSPPPPSKRTHGYR